MGNSLAGKETFGADLRDARRPIKSGCYRLERNPDLYTAFSGSFLEAKKNSGPYGTGAAKVSWLAGGGTASAFSSAFPVSQWPFRRTFPITVTG